MSYFNLIEMLISTFFVICIIMLPTIIIYSTDTGYVGKVSKSQESYAFSTLGNLGHVSSQCIHQFIIVEHEMYPKCFKGKLSKLSFVGLIPDIQGGEF